MLALILVIVVTVFSMFVSCSINTGEPTWLEYYHGVMAGFLISGIILQISNKLRRLKEVEKKPRTFKNLVKDWN